MIKNNKSPLQATAIGSDRKFRRVVFYVRYSSDNQKYESIEAQIKVLTEYAKAHDMIVVEIYADEAKTATDAKRENFQRMLNDSADGNFDTVLVFKLNRFARNRTDAAIIRDQLRKNGVKIVSATENTSGPTGALLESIHEGLAETYSRELSAYSTDSLYANALLGKNTGGKPAYGYDTDPATRKLVVNEQEAFVVNQIFEKYAAGISYTEIFKWINDNGFKTKNNEPFKKNSLHFILKNQKYIGNFPYKKYSQSKYEQEQTELVMIEGVVPSIVKQETFDIVQNLLERNKHNSQMNKAKEIYVLSGKAFCGQCGSRMVGNRRKNKKTGNYWSGYQCSGRKKHICTAKEVNKSKLEDLVIDHLEQEVFTNEFIDETAQKVLAYYTDSTSERTTELTSAKARLREINAQIDNILKAVMDGFASDILRIKLQELEQAKKDCGANIAILTAKERDHFSVTDIKKYLSLGKGISSLDHHEQQRILSQFVERVVVNEDSVDIQLVVDVMKRKRGLRGDPYAYRFLSTFLLNRTRDFTDSLRDKMGHFISRKKQVVLPPQRDQQGRFISV